MRSPTRRVACAKYSPRMLKSGDAPQGEDKAAVDTAKCICDSGKASKVAKLPRKENANAKNRWRLLARAILSNSNRDVKTKERSAISNLSRDFSGFDLVACEQLKKDDTQTFVIKIAVASNKYECSVHIEQLWTMKDLIGFNNTGNCQFWASEAALTYFVMDNLRMFDNAWVLELGGGMFCLAGLMLAKCSDAFAVHLSDGNQSSVNNVRKSLMLNETNCFVKTSGGLSC